MLLLLLLLLLLRYEGGRLRLSRRIGELPFPAGRAGGGRAVLVKADVVTKRSARALLTVVGGRGERTLLRCEAATPVVPLRLLRCGDVLIIYFLFA